MDQWQAQEAARSDPKMVTESQEIDHQVEEEKKDKKRSEEKTTKNKRLKYSENKETFFYLDLD